MKKTVISKIAASLAIVMVAALSFSACSEVKKTEETLLNDAKSFVVSAKEELGKVKTEAVSLEEDTEKEIHTVITNAENSLKKVEGIIEEKASDAVEAAKKELGVAKTELEKVKTEAKKLEEDTSKEIHSFINNVESKIKEAEKALEGK